jgi:hypothetical protein
MTHGRLLGQALGTLVSSSCSASPSPPRSSARSPTHPSPTPKPLCCSPARAQVIVKYGFEPTQAGAMKFTSDLQKYREDPELKAYADNLKARFMPFAGPSDEGAD